MTVIHDNYAEPPDDLQIKCKNCGKPIQFELYYGHYECVHIREGDLFDNIACDSETVIVEEKKDDRSHHTGSSFTRGEIR